ncbi:MAG TPA: Rossmann-like and DUF2520 domain-containing protein [Gemmatimonadaceae bacterium]|nr:Rossmann-like and DUF2520 domain-containing protein [Gemmatimonadaceae bacterium]
MTDAVFIVGAGRAGRGLSRALRASGTDVVGLHGRRVALDPDVVTAGPLPRTLAGASVVIVAVRDAQLDGALGELAGAPLGAGAVVLHASGSAEPRTLAPLRAAGHPCGTFHPLVPLADPSRAAALLRGAWIGTDGDREAVAAAVRLAARLGAHALRIPAGEKATYHAAAVFASNFPTVLAAVAARLLAGAGIAEDEAWGAVRALMRGAVANLDDATAAHALTGPIARGDVETIRKHLDALSSEPATRALYATLSLAAVELARGGGASDAASGEIRRLLTTGP